MKKETTPEERIERLTVLRDTVALHKGQRRKPVKLNGVFRCFHMGHWDCGTKACAFGSYALTPYGQYFWKKLGRSFLLREGNKRFRSTHSTHSTIDKAAWHFGITRQEAMWLFLPDSYSVDEEAIAPYQVVRRIESLIRQYS